MAGAPGSPPNAPAGLGLEAPDLGDHVGQILVIHAADLAEKGKVAPAQRREVLDHRLHGGIETVTLAQLQRQAFGQRAGENAGRLQGLHPQKHVLDACPGGPELFGDVGGRADEVAGLIQAVDQRRPDHALGRTGEEGSRIAGAGARSATPPPPHRLRDPAHRLP